MKGHLWAGRELYTTGREELGATHLGHPYAEHYRAASEALQARGVDEAVHEALEELAEHADERPEWSKLEAHYDQAQRSLDQAIATVDADLRNDAAFIGDVLVGVLREAGHEYGEALQDGRFVNTVEYQDGRGFALVGHQLLVLNEDLIAGADPEVYRELSGLYDRILEAWPSVMPPDQPELSHSELLGRISRFELAANNL
jgi:hypothetical protein